MPLFFESGQTYNEYILLSKPPYSTVAGYISFHLQVFHETQTLNIYYSFTRKCLQLSPVQKLRTVLKCSTNLQLLTFIHKQIFATYAYKT